jgi:hypothetical protein
MRSICRLFFILVLALTGFLSSGKASALEAGLDVNDASVLFPIDGLRKPVPYLGLEEESLLPLKIFNELISRATAMGIAAPQTSAIALPTDWNIMGFRYDPCAPEDHGLSNEPCVSELRLVAQPRSRFTPADSAIHLLYKINPGQPNADDPLLADLLSLKQKSQALSGLSTDGRPLGVHPLLAEALKSKNDAIPKLFGDFVRKYARSEQLIKVTMMGLRKGTPTDWIFFGGNVENGAWVQTSIPNVKSVADSMVELVINGATKSFKGRAIDPDLSLAPFFGGPQGDLASYIAATDKAIHTLENPSLSDRNTADCISCHAATSVRLSGEFEFSAKVDGISASVPRAVTAFPAPGALPNHPLNWNLRAFGYFGLVPTVSMRSVNEAGRAVELINKIMNRRPTGPDCSLVVDQVMSCFVESSTQFATKSSTEECLSLCRQPGRGR